MKIVKHKNLMGFLFAIFLMLPFFSIFARGFYVTFNKNAKDSYYGETINEVIYTSITSTNDLVNNQEYYLSFGGINNLNSYYIGFSNPSDIETNVTLIDFDTVKYFRIYSSNTLIFFDANRNTVQTITGNGSNYFKMQFILNGFDMNYDLNAIYTISYNKYSYLDNAFTYSISKFVEDNPSKINFFSFFANLFLDLNNPQVNLYVSFVNWYLNYTLLISLGYLLFMFLMWFINYIRQLLEKGNSFGHGGF